MAETHTSRTSGHDGETESIAIREAINAALAEELARDEDVLLLGEDVGTSGGVFGKTDGLLDEFGDDRVRDTPITEAGFVGASVGAAATGLRPVVEIMFNTFLGVATDQLLNQVAKMRYMLGGQVELPLTILTQEALGRNAAAQHSGSLHTWFAHLPGVKVVAPGTAAATKGLLKASIRSDDPVLFFENLMIYEQEGPVPTDESFTLPIGQAGVERVGEDVTVVATHRLVGETLALAEDLAGEVSLEVIDPRTLYPLDVETIASSVSKTGRLVVADESPLSYGTHAEIMAIAMENCFFDLDAPVQRVGVPDVNIPFSPPLEDEVTPMREDVERAVRRLT